jgi:hypothetical protein
MSVMTDDVNGDDLIPIHRPPRAGRVIVFIEATLRTSPGEWSKYPHDFSALTARTIITKYPQRYPGTEWAFNRRGELLARWVGD